MNSIKFRVCDLKQIIKEKDSGMSGGEKRKVQGSLQSAGDIVTIPAMFSSDPTAHVCEYES